MPLLSEEQSQNAPEHGAFETRARNPNRKVVVIPRIASREETVIEPVVDALQGAEFLGIRPRRLLQMARAGDIPAHPIGCGKRKTWRFRLSELAEAISAKSGIIDVGSPRQPNRRN